MITLIDNQFDPNKNWTNSLECDLSSEIENSTWVEWINLEFFQQSKYKTDFFGLPTERFKLVAWE